MSLPDLAVLDRFSITGFQPGYNPAARTFYAPVDNPHGALVTLAAAATLSLVVAMYSFDDDELAQIVHDKIGLAGCFVQISLDASQAAGAHERAILTKQDYPATSIAVGHSERGAIMHMKMMIIDGLDLVDGSTNWSSSGERLQDNQLTVTRDPLAAARARSRTDTIHDAMLKQMAAVAAGKPLP